MRGGLDQRGTVAIFLTMFILSTMLFVAITASDIIQNGLKMSRAHINATKAYFGAEAGAERILWEVRKNGHNPVGPPAWNLGGGNRCVRFDAYPTGDIHNNRTHPCNNTNLVKQELVNVEVDYWIRYNYIDPTIEFGSVGDYKGETRRMVEISYEN